MTSLREFAELEQEEDLSGQVTKKSVVEIMESKGYDVEESRSYTAVYAEDEEHHSDVDPNPDQFMIDNMDEVDTTQTITEYEVKNSESEAVMLVEEDSGYVDNVHFEEPEETGGKYLRA